MYKAALFLASNPTAVICVIPDENLWFFFLAICKITFCQLHISQVQHKEERFFLYISTQPDQPFCVEFFFFFFWCICYWILNQARTSIRGILEKTVFCILHHLNRSAEPSHLNKNKIQRIARLNYAFNFKSDHCVYLQRAFWDKWLLLKWWSYQHMAAFLLSYTVKKIELSHLDWNPSYFFMLHKLSEMKALFPSLSYRIKNRRNSFYPHLQKCKTVERILINSYRFSYFSSN